MIVVGAVDTGATDPGAKAAGVWVAGSGSAVDWVADAMDSCVEGAGKMGAGPVKVNAVTTGVSSVGEGLAGAVFAKVT